MISHRIGCLTFGILLLAAALDVPVAAADAPSISGNLQSLHGYYYRDIRAVADQLSADQYAFQPNGDVRTVGQLLAHIAQASFTLCALMNDAPMPAAAAGLEDRAEALGKAGIERQLAAAERFCDQAIAATVLAETASGAGGPLRKFVFEGKPVARGAVAAFHASHIAHHYGNLVTYMRVLGEEPPSAGRLQRR